MKETIYTIPINDAFDQDCACALCEIETKLDRENTEAALGAGMMEPDLRILSNEKGFCKTHYQAMMAQGQALALSLVLQSHSEHQNNQLAKALDSGTPSKGLFKKDSGAKNAAQKAVDCITQLEHSCAICEKTQKQMQQYLANILYLWKTQKDFRDKFQAKKGFCLPHFSLLLQTAMQDLNAKDFDTFYNILIAMEKQSLSKMYQDISAFTKLFDYKSSGEASEDVKTAIKRTIHTYAGLKPETD